MQKETLYRLMLGTAGLSGAALLDTVGGGAAALAAFLPGFAGVIEQASTDLFGRAADDIPLRLARLRGRGRSVLEYEHLEELASSLRAGVDSVTRAIDRAHRETIASLRETIVHQHQALVEQVKAHVVRPLSDALERGWEETTAETHFPFEYRRPETHLVGARAQELVGSRFDGFLADERRFCWWLWTGREGAGKSRLAMEACCAREDEWDVGFVTPERRAELAADWHRTSAGRDTLLVFDDIGSDPAAVRRALGELLARFGAEGELPDPPRVRVLLLERHGEPLTPLAPSHAVPRWFAELFPVRRDGVDGRSRALIAAQHPAPRAPSEHLEALQHADARALATAYAEKLPRLDEQRRQRAADDALALLGSETRPLHVLLATHMLAYESDLADFGAVMTHWLGGRIESRRARLEAAGLEEADATKVINLVAVATVLGQLDLDQLDGLRHELLPRRDLLTRRVLEAIGQRPGDGSIRGIEPHLIGEWFVYLWVPPGPLGGTLRRADLLAILDGIDGSFDALRTFVQRTFRTFRGNDLWRILSDRLGRYATPFGALFDTRQQQAALLRGSTDEAIAHYRGQVERHVEQLLSTHAQPVVVDLMAGGSDLPAQLLGRYPSVRYLAVDRDVSRIDSGNAPDGRLERVQEEITGATDVGALLASRWDRRRTCDLVIAKKALHEMPWSDQQALIAHLGRIVRPGGAVVLYADSPDAMDAPGRYRLARLVRDSGLEIGSAEGGDLAAARATLLGDLFGTDDPADAAVFANLWIKLKDWANYNRHEWEQRYFSSITELTGELQRAGFSLAGADGGGVERFTMRLHAPRFQEDVINRLSYLVSTERAATDQELAAEAAPTPRYQLFWQFVRTHLWNDGAPTDFGRSVGVELERPCSLDMLLSSEMLELTGENVRFPVLEEPSFVMPIHVLSLRRVDRS